MRTIEVRICFYDIFEKGVGITLLQWLDIPVLTHNAIKHRKITDIKFRSEFVCSGETKEN